MPGTVTVGVCSSSSGGGLNNRIAADVGDHGSIAFPIHVPIEHFTLASDEHEDTVPVSSSAKEDEDEQWWAGVEAAIRADNNVDDSFGRTPKITNLLDPASSNARRRISAKRPALPHETEGMPPGKRKRPG
jgi:hypothetical protein